jgi:hypothetical protein
MMGDSPMNRLLLVFACALFLSGVGPLAASAQDAQGGAAPKTKSHWSWLHHEKSHREKSDPITSTQNSTHKSSGWWHRSGPGPAGAGADQKTKSSRSWFHHEKRQSVKTAPLYTSPKSVGWWHNGGPGPVGAGAS